MKVLVTGACGLVGREVVVKLRESGHEVIASDLGETSPDEFCELGIEYRPADITDFDQFRRVLNHVEALIHCAAIFDLGAPRELLDKVNVAGTEIVCSASVEAGVQRLILVSTVGVYGRQKDVPIFEDAPKNPHNNYERSKWLSEQTAFRHHSQSGLRVSALRPTLVYGPRAAYGLAMFATLMSVIRIASPIKGFPVVDGGPLTHLVHVEDVARATVFLLSHDDAIGQSFNVADHAPVRLENAFDVFIKRFGLKRYGTLPYIPAVWKPLIMSLGSLPGFAATPLNGIMKKTWRKLIDKGDIVDVLKPRFDFDWVGYGDRDFVYSTEKLQSAGFVFKHPNFFVGFEKTMDWYMDNRWIPDFRQGELSKTLR